MAAQVRPFKVVVQKVKNVLHQIHVKHSTVSKHWL